MSNPYTDDIIAMDRQTAKLVRSMRCKYCKSTENLTVDHKIPLILGGADEAKNWQPLCKDCNTAKSSLRTGRYASYLNGF